MELPQPRPLETEGRKATHDFLSLHSPVQQDPRPPQGGYLKTQDLLQPLERVGKHATKEENKIVITAIEKPPPPGPPPSVEHVLPGGIGTCSISYLNQRVLKPEGSLFMAQASTTRSDENQNPDSYAGSGLMLWDESSVKKGQTGKENIAAERHVLRESGLNGVGGKWMTVLEPPSQSSSNRSHNSNTLSSFLSSQPSSSQKNKSLKNMMTSATNDREEDYDDGNEEFVVKKETTPYPKGNFSVNVEGKPTDQKPNTARSKHSATEKRRRSKINDRFQRLREIIPHSEQKRDKASFLLEVIEYIQFLQEKVHKYESSYNVWNHEPSKFLQCSQSHIAEGFIDHSRGMNPESTSASVFPAKFDENKNFVSPAIPINGQNLVESDTKTATTSRDREPSLRTKTAPVLPIMQRNIFSFGSTGIAASPDSPIPASDADKTATWPQSHLLQNRSRVTECTVVDDKMKNQELTIESGTISISNAYSQKLLNTLTQALKNTGVDLSRANISVRIDLGKRAPVSSASTVKDEDDVPTGNKALPRSRAASTEESEQALKRLKTR
ncbi:transcription factor BIM1-like isoform X3 [Olea europaea var. sylvestris]|uniref:transcription factor BIM1-like isoform X3 n=1 Tax=Olea europaea var. sylvestris TaxID=158386 RepID=UPI000C1CEAAD|nr:transcription factor BIM1-like isoform X3 [Olea europaea var. sylvestris]